MANVGADSMDDIWFVQLPNGNVRAWSLDELDAEFQKGTINEGTLVRQGVAPWTKLSALLGLDDAPPPISSGMAVSVSVAPAAIAPYQIPSMPPPPVVMSLDEDVDLDFMAPPASRKKKVMMGVAAAALVLCGGVFALTKVTSGAPAAASAVGQNANASIAQIAAPAPPPAPVAAPAAAQLDAPKGAPLTDLQRKALLTADKNRERVAKEAKEKKAKLAPARRSPRSASPFHKNGSKGDPLNITF